MSQSGDIGKRTSQPSRTDSQREEFRQCLRDADQFIKERRFDKAKARLEVAKALEPGNVYLAAFRDRIRLFESGTEPPPTSSSAPRPAPSQGSQHAEAPAAAGAKHADQVRVSRETIEQKLRQQIEAEYMTKFMHELQKAEVLATRSLEEERSRLSHQREILKAQFDNQVAETQKRLDAEYQQRLDDEVSSVEQRLKQQFEQEQGFIENEMKTRLTHHYEDQMRELEEKLKRGQEELIERERRSSSEREKTMKEEFNRKLLESLRKTETLFREQSQQQQQTAQEELRQRLTAEFQATLTKEREGIKRQYDAEMEKLSHSIMEEQKRLREESERQVAAQLESLRAREADELEKKRAVMVHDVEAELQAKYQDQIAGERARIQAEADKLIECEKMRLQEQYDGMIRAQNEIVQNVRKQLRIEMEESFISRLEQIATQYDHKMELLGAKPPATLEEKTAFYRDRMRACYASGQPSVDDAKRLMELKEILELSFDDHLCIESDVRLDLYSENVEKKVLGGEFDLNNSAKLDELKEQFRITQEEALRLEPHILASFQRLAVKGKILVVDDEPMLLDSVNSMLTDCGYQVFTALDIKTGLEKLKTMQVDLILSDIKFGPDEFDGFNFFKAIQEQPHLRKIPFVFMSSLRDGVIVRSGVQLGVDDYLTKPVEPDMLIAVIEGKLKRYRDVQRR